MKKLKYIEVILPEAIVQAFIVKIEMHKLEAYSVKTGLTGKSKQGLATAGFCDAAVTIICDESDALNLILAVRDFLNHFGGIGCVIEANGFNLGP